MDRYGDTALHCAAAGGYEAAVQALLAAGAPATARNGAGENALHCAVAARSAGCCSALLAAEPTLAGVPDMGGRTPGAVACARGYGELCGQLGVAAPEKALPVAQPPTLVLAPPLCMRHRTAESTARRAPSPPPENVDRLSVLLQPRIGVLRAAEFVDSTRLDERCARRCDMGDVLRVHEWSYVQKIKSKIEQVPEGTVGSLDGDTAVCDESWAAALAAAGAACEAVDRVLAGDCRNAFCAVRPPGHHAGPLGPVSANEPPGQGSHGFCLLNNVAIAAAYARCCHRNAVQRVAIIDFDVHHGNGTEAIVEAAVPSTVKLPFVTPLGEASQ